MADNYYDKVVRMISDSGWRKLPKSRQPSGSHEMWENEVGNKVPVPRKLASRHTANGILKFAGVSGKL